MEDVKATMEPTTEKIKATNVMIIVESINDSKPYYCIRYYDVAKKQTYIGYGSYNLDYVVQWKEEFFEIVENNKVAEEYATETNVGNIDDCCKWEYAGNGEWNTSCKEFKKYLPHGVLLFDFCPYCRKEIKQAYEDDGK